MKILKKIVHFFADGFFEMLLNNTIHFILWPLAFFLLWCIGSLFGKISFFFSLGFVAIFLLQGPILHAMDPDRYNELLAKANGGKPFLQTRPAVYLFFAAVLVLITCIVTFVSEAKSDNLPFLIVLAVLSAGYIGLFLFSAFRKK